MCLYFGLWIFAFIVIRVDAGCCKDGWLPFQESCYYFGHSAVHFTEAEAYCRQHESHLIHVNDELEDSFIKSRLKDMQDRHWWLGLTDEDINGHWVWFDTNSTPEYTGWDNAQPQDNNEHCAVFAHGHSFRWHDVACTSDIGSYALCEAESEEAESVIG